jgi:formylglycine-generating enzyme required for sulfatase activity
MMMVLPFLLSIIVSSRTTAAPPGGFEYEPDGPIRLEMAKEGEVAVEPTAAERKMKAKEVEEAEKATAAERKRKAREAAEAIAAEKAGVGDKLMEAAEAAKALILEKLPPINMVVVEGGCFQMGDFAGIGDEDESPVHEVCVSDYYIADTEVTQELWEAVMRFNPLPEKERDPKKPVSSISWFWVDRFITKLNLVTDGFYRLPSEAEWEYAARDRGKDISWSGTDDESRLGLYAWFEDNSDFESHRVRGKRPNGLGLYDMAGNVWEWVDDFFDFDYYQTSPVENPYGPEESIWRGLRGGSMLNETHRLRSTYRYAGDPANSLPYVGFRLAE